jgi:hypothetical protein
MMVLQHMHIWQGSYGVCKVVHSMDRGQPSTIALHPVCLNANTAAPAVLKQSQEVKQHYCHARQQPMTVTQSCYQSRRTAVRGGTALMEANGMFV